MVKNYDMDDELYFVHEYVNCRHNGQVDKAGRPYIEHLEAVSNGCSTIYEKMTGLLHDVFEDTNTSEDELRLIGVPEEVIKAVRAMTRKHSETYDEFIKRVSKNKIATAVKLSDLKHNMDLSRLPAITEKDLKRYEKYKKAYAFLTDCKCASVDDQER